MARESGPTSATRQPGTHAHMAARVNGAYAAPADITGRELSSATATLGVVDASWLMLLTARSHS